MTDGEAHVVYMPSFIRARALLSFLFPVRYTVKSTTVSDNHPTVVKLQRYRVYKGRVEYDN